MNSDRRKLIQHWLVAIAFVVTISLWERSIRFPPRWSPWILTGAIVAVAIYFVLNAGDFKQIQKRSETHKEILEEESRARMWVVVAGGVQFIVCIIFLLRGKNLGELISDVWSMIFAFLFPLSVPFIVSQARLFRRLGRP
jgi:uncharacterized membrane protein